MVITGLIFFISYNLPVIYYKRKRHINAAHGRLGLPGALLAIFIRARFNYLWNFSKKISAPYLIGLTACFSSKLTNARHFRGYSFE